MSDVTRKYIVGTKLVAEVQYASLRSALTMTMQRQGWKVDQVSFIVGARSLNEEEFKKNLTFFEVPPTSIETIRAKLDLKIFDEYANMLKGGSTPPLINSLTAWQTNKVRKHKEREKK